MTELPSALDTGTLDELRDSMGGDDEFFAELVDEFLADGPVQLESLRTALSSGDADSARRAAHTLKGTGRTFGAETLASLCQEVETAAAAGDMDAGLARIDGIDHEWARVQSELVPLRETPA